MKPLNKEFKLSNRDLALLKAEHNKSMETESAKELVSWLKTINADYEIDLLAIRINKVDSLTFRKNWFKIVTKGHVEIFTYDDNWQLIFKENELFIKIK